MAGIKRVLKKNDNDMKRIVCMVALCVAIVLPQAGQAQKVRKNAKVRKTAAIENQATAAETMPAAPADTFRAVLPFRGTIRYDIHYESPDIPAEQLSAQPASAIVKILDTKMLLDTKVTKTIFNADENRAYNLINLSAMGLGRYQLTETAEDMRDTSEKQNYVLRPTDETKPIFGYTAKKAVGSYTSPEAEVTFEVWYVEHFCTPFFNLMENSFIDLDGFPLEYELSMHSVQGIRMTTRFSVRELQYGDTDAAAFHIAKSYQTVSEAELQQILEDFMSAFE